MVSEQKSEGGAESSASPSALKGRIEEMRASHRPKAVDLSATATHSLVSRMVVDLFAGCVFGAGIGYWLDSVFSTKPLFFIVLGIVGIIAGFLNMYRTHLRYSADEPPQTEPYGAMNKKSEKM